MDTEENINKLSNELQILINNGECDHYRIQTLQTKLRYLQLEKRLQIVEDKLRKYEEN